MTTNATTLLAADLVHVATGVRVEFRGVRWIVHRVVQVDSISRAIDLLREEAAVRITEDTTSVLPLPATRDLRAPVQRRRSFRRWLLRLFRRPVWS